MCTIEVRPYQITLTPKINASLAILHELVLELLAVEGAPGVSVACSSHSVDILAPGVSKRLVVEATSARLPKSREDTQVLRVGDSGTWNGNDIHLLSSPFSLSVAHCPLNLSWAWNLAPPGHRGSQAALDYINAMRFDGNGFSLDIERLLGGVR